MKEMKCNVKRQMTAVREKKGKQNKKAIKKKLFREKRFKKNHDIFYKQLYLYS